VVKESALFTRVVKSPKNHATTRKNALMGPQVVKGALDHLQLTRITGEPRNSTALYIKRLLLIAEVVGMESLI